MQKLHLETFLDGSQKKNKFCVHLCMCRGCKVRTSECSVFSMYHKYKKRVLACIMNTVTEKAFYVKKYHKKGKLVLWVEFQRWEWEMCFEDNVDHSHAAGLGCLWIFKTPLSRPWALGHPETHHIASKWLSSLSYELKMRFLLLWLSFHLFWLSVFTSDCMPCKFQVTWMYMLYMYMIKQAN